MKRNQNFDYAIADKVGKLLCLRDEQHIGGVLSAGIEFPALIALTELDVVDKKAQFRFLKIKIALFSLINKKISTCLVPKEG